MTKIVTLPGVSTCCATSFEYLRHMYLSSVVHTTQRALLLHLVGPETQEIFETFSDIGDDFKTALAKLDSYF